MIGINNKSLLKALNIVISNFKNRGFTVILIYLDLQFKELKPLLEKWCNEVNLVYNRKYILEVEYYIRTIKERVKLISSNNL